MFTFPTSLIPNLRPFRASPSQASWAGPAASIAASRHGWGDGANLPAQQRVTCWEKNGAILGPGEITSDPTIWEAPTPETAPLLPTVPAIGVRGEDGALLKALLASGPVSVRLVTEPYLAWTMIPIGAEVFRPSLPPSPSSPATSPRRARWHRFSGRVRVAAVSE